MFDLGGLKLRTKRCRSAPLVFSFSSCFFSSSILFNASHDKIFLRSLELGILTKAPIQNQTPKVVHKIPQFKRPKRKVKSELKLDLVAWSWEQSRVKRVMRTNTFWKSILTYSNTIYCNVLDEQGKNRKKKKKGTLHHSPVIPSRKIPHSDETTKR